MDNSIWSLIGEMNRLLESVELFKGNIKHHVIIQPRAQLEDALRNGFPEDLYQQYMSECYQKDVDRANDIIKEIEKELIPWIKDVTHELHEAVNLGAGGAAASGFGSGSSSSSSSSSSSGSGSGSGSTSGSGSGSGSGAGAVNPQYRPRPLPVDESQIRAYEQWKALQDNDKAIEDALKIKKGPGMTIAEADKQNANPHLVDEYIEDPNGDYEFIDGTRCRKNPKYNSDDKKYYEQFKVNCATCATAYALRLRGFDVKAKGNVKGSGSLNEKISNANEYLNVWKNLDGTKAEAVHTDDWMKKNGIGEMTTNDYRNYFEETCKEKGVYVVMVRWSDDSSGHATILQRDADGVLYYIEPQRYEMSKGADGKRSLNDLLMMHDGSQKLSSKPTHGYGVLRVDNKIFNTDYAGLFDI